MKFLGRLKELSKLKKVLLGVIIIGGAMFIGFKALNNPSSTVNDSANQLVDNLEDLSDDNLDNELEDSQDEAVGDEVIGDEYISQDEFIDYSDGTIEQITLLGSSMSSDKLKYGVGQGYLFDMSKNNGILTLNVRAINDTYVVHQTANIIGFIKEYQDLVSGCTQIKYNAYAGEGDTTIKEKETLYKILSFTLGSNEINGILNNKINFTTVMENASEVWKHPKLRD